MKQQFLSIAEYIESLEQRIAALEERLEKLETPKSPEPIESLESLEQPAPAPEPEPEPAPAPEPVLQPAPVHPTQDIRQSISLGDRFLFQRELFHNNGELMQRTLDEINACASLDEALQRISAFNWDQESTTYKLFLNVLNRRF